MWVMFGQRGLVVSSPSQESGSGKHQETCKKTDELISGIKFNSDPQFRSNTGYQVLRHHQNNQRSVARVLQDLLLLLHDEHCMSVVFPNMNYGFAQSNLISRYKTMHA
jgi:hypothetical protein